MSNFLFICFFFLLCKFNYYFVQELYHLAEGVSEDDASLVFNKSVRFIKDAIKEDRYQ
jgi:hypothetical protein